MLKKTGLLLALSLCAFLTAPPTALAVSDVPDAIIKAPLLIPETTVSTYIPSTTAPGPGLAVSIVVPRRPRYKDGAPVVVVVPGSDSNNGLSFSAHTSQSGFVEVRFAFPGGGIKGFHSGGIYDYRGWESQQALRDILLFAAGKSEDNDGKHIGDLLPVPVSPTNVGLIGWDNGGNVAIATLAKFPDKLQFVQWLAFYESPVGSMFFPPNLGGDRDLVINRHYRPGSCATGECLVDYRKLAYDANGLRGADQRKRRGELILPGIIYFDDNKNGSWDEATEFAFSYALDVGLDKQIYPPDVTAAMQRMGIFRVWEEEEGPYAKKRDAKNKQLPDPDADLLNPKQMKAREKERSLKTKLWQQQTAEKLTKEPNPEFKVDNGKIYRHKLKWPTNIATVEESQAYFEERDGSQFVDTVCSKYPNLLVTIFGGQIDHLQRQADHPHVALLYNAFLTDKAHWVRLNPDPVYVGSLGTMNAKNFNDNKPNSPIDAASIADQLEPEGLIPDYLFMDAAACELADRIRAKDPLAELTAVLVNYPYGAGPMPRLDTK